MNRIGLGIIGLGVGKGALLLNRDPDTPIEVRAVADLDPARLELASSEHDVGFTTADYNELLARPDVDVVGIFTPDHLHTEHVIAALNAGKHVVCTKPLTTNLEDCDRMVGLVRKTGLKFVMAQTWRVLPKVAAAKKALDEGQIGRINFIETGYIHDLRKIVERTPWRVTVPQELLFGGGAHAIDCLRWFAGNIVEVSAFARSSEVLPGYPIEDIWNLNLKFESGALGRVLVMCGSVNSSHDLHQHVQIYGTKGTIIGLDIAVEADPEHRTLDTLPLLSAGPIIDGHAVELVPYFRKMAQWIENDEIPEPNIIDGARAVAVGVAAKESLKSGRAEKVRNDF